MSNFKSRISRSQQDAPNAPSVHFLPAVQKIGRAGAVYGTLLLVPLVILDARWLAFAAVAGMWGIGALGLGLIMGYGGQLSLGHAAVIGVGAYAAGIAARDWGWSHGTTILASIAASLVLALVTLPILRLRGYYLALATLALGIIIARLISTTGSLTGGASGLVGIPPLQLGPVEFLSDERWWALVVLVIFLCHVLIRKLVMGAPGRAIAVLHDDEDLMPSVGLNPFALKARLYLVGSAITGVSGGLLAHRLGFLSPEQFGVETSILLALVVILGGATSWWGPLIGTVIFRIMDELFLDQPHLRGVAIPLVVIALMFAAPDGVMGVIRRAAAFLSSNRASTSPAAPDPDILEPLAIRPKSDTVLLQVRSVSKGFGGLQVLDDVSFDVRAGEVVGLIGPNGAGKTTLLNMIAGQLPVDGGDIVYRGRSLLTDKANHPSRRGMVRTFQTPRLVDRLSVLGNVAVGADSTRAKDSELVASVELQRVGRSDLAQLSRHELPFGDLRATEFARALAMAPDLLLLDEAAAGLADGDLVALKEMIRSCATAGIGVVLVEHNMEFLSGAVDRIVALADGRVVAQGPPDYVLSDPAVVEHYLGSPK